MDCHIASNNNKRGIIMIPYADLTEYESSVNINLISKNARKELYLKNCCVACLSAAEHIEASHDIALVTNIDVPEPYLSLLQEKNIKIINIPFDIFNFGASYSWSLAFYKLCVLYHSCRELDYDFYSYLDSDVYIQSDFSNIWKECENKILLYDINHGLQVPNYRHFIDEVQKFLPEKRYITHFGGEFFAASKEMAQIFSESCLSIFQEMIDKKYTTTHGDEFIVSIAADCMINHIKNAGAYIHRFWTGSFRLVSTNYKYDPVNILHIPSEKNDGIIHIFDYYVKHKKMPPREKVWKLLHLHHRKLSISMKVFLKSIFVR